MLSGPFLVKIEKPRKEGNVYLLVEGFSIEFDYGTVVLSVINR